MDLLSTTAIVTGVVVVGALVLVPALFRTVVSTNETHIVQSARRTVSFGKDQPAGNAYYWWPAWFPFIGITTTRLPMSVFSEKLVDYAAYDKDRLPFIVDVIAFFRITEPNMAGQRVKNFAELQNQLTGILQGAIRSILANSSIQDIMEGRSEFGKKFTAEVDHQLVEWGVQNVKTIELMDLRDAPQSNVIANIMAKKKSHIEQESRVEVAKNMQTAKTAEIDAEQAVKVRAQDAEQAVGVRTAEAQKSIQVASQQATQAIREQERLTAEKTMAIQQVNTVRQAEITKAAGIVDADKAKAVQALQAEADLITAENLAKATFVKGEATAKAAELMQLAPVNAQITLAKEIGSNDGYQRYLVSIKQVDANQAVGVAQASALTKADIKIIANAGDAASGLDSARGLLSSKTGQDLGALIEGIANTPTGAAALRTLGIKGNGAAATK